MKELGNKLIANLHVFLLIYGLYGAYVVWDEHSVQVEQVQAQFPPIEAEIAATEKKVSEIQEFVKKADEYKVRVEEVARNIETVQKQLPAETNDNQIMSFFRQEASLLNMRDPEVSSGKEEQQTYFIAKEYRLKAKGTFLQFLILLERIGNATRIYNVKDLKLLSTEANQKGRFQVITGEIVIQAYRFNPEFRVDRGF